MKDIDVKEKSNGNYFYAVGLEKTNDTRPTDILSEDALTDDGKMAAVSLKYNIL